MEFPKISKFVRKKVITHGSIQILWIDAQMEDLSPYLSLSILLFLPFKRINKYFEKYKILNNIMFLAIAATSGVFYATLTLELVLVYFGDFLNLIVSLELL